MPIGRRWQLSTEGPGNPQKCRKLTFEQLTFEILFALALAASERRLNNLKGLKDFYLKEVQNLALTVLSVPDSLDSGMAVADTGGVHVETLIIYELSPMKFTTQNDICK